MQLAEQAEGYIKEQSMPDQHGGSLSRSQYDHHNSRSEWEDRIAE